MLISIPGILGNPVFDGSLLLVLVIFEVFLLLIEWDVRRTAKASHEIEKKTYEMYKSWIETTENRKAEAREKAAATRARKREALQLPQIEGETPPPMALEDQAADESDS
jgi:hypothetical protein